MGFKLASTFKPTGDQPRAIAELTDGIMSGKKHQTLLGVTGSGKTFTMAHVIERLQKPTLVISHNKTLAAQTYQEFKEFFPQNSVHYFVSYYDYYQPEAYIPQSDTYIEKDAAINEELDRLRHAATQALLTRKDTIIVASVSCIYNIGSPEEYKNLSFEIFEGQKIKRKEFLSHLVNLQYERNEIDKRPGTFSARGEIIEVRPSTGEEVIRVEIPKNGVKSLEIGLPSTFGNPTSKSRTSTCRIFPAKFWVSPQENIDLAEANIRSELQQRLKELRGQNKLLEAQRLEQRTNYDLEMLKESGYCHGIENYSSHLEFRKSGSPPFTLLDYFQEAAGEDWLMFIDESHMTVPQIRGMYNGDRSRKQTLIEYGFRLPSALDNRPLRFEEFEEKVPQAVYVSATPAQYELQMCGNAGDIVEQLIRPTGLLDPIVEVRKTENQIPDFIAELRKRIAKGQRVLATVLTKRLAEELSDYLKEEDIKVNYLHSEIKTLERPEILRDLRLGKYDVVVGVNLLREGLDLPEVSLVAIFDADKEGFLRNATTLIQTMGRAARHNEGSVIMYADTMTESMKTAIRETQRRRRFQEEFNRKNNLTPQTVTKPIRESMLKKEEPSAVRETPEMPYSAALAKELERKMKKAATNLDFESAARMRDMIRKLGKK